MSGRGAVVPTTYLFLFGFKCFRCFVAVCCTVYSFLFVLCIEELFVAHLSLCRLFVYSYIVVFVCLDTCFAFSYVVVL